VLTGSSRSQIPQTDHDVDSTASRGIPQTDHDADSATTDKSYLRLVFILGWVLVSAGEPAISSEIVVATTVRFMTSRHGVGGGAAMTNRKGNTSGDSI
jgi:hypothetical protein